jgi:dienelactone hydrolase
VPLDNDLNGQTQDRGRLKQLLGAFAPTRLRIVARGALPPTSRQMRAERLDLAAPDGARIRGILTGPAGDWRGRPAVLYCHAHGNRYGVGAAELIDGRPALQPEPYGPALAREGIVAFCIDMPCFGERAQETESALSKRLHWQGRTLFGLMLSELAGAFDLLAGLDGVDPGRIAAFGFSMGASHAFWLGALEPRIRAVAHACAFADLAELIAAGGHDLHGPYMTVPGLVPAIGTGRIAGLVAPRPQLALMGALDPLTPPAATATAVTELRLCYERADAAAALSVHIGEASGHDETPAMRAAVLTFLSQTLNPFVSRSSDSAARGRA